MVTRALVLLAIGASVFILFRLLFGISAWLARSTGVPLQPSLDAAELLVALAIFSVGLALATLPVWRMQRVTLAAAMKGD